MDYVTTRVSSMGHLQTEKERKTYVVDCTFETTTESHDWWN